jgi:hypothetical protein
MGPLFKDLEGVFTNPWAAIQYFLHMWRIIELEQK